MLEPADMVLRLEKLTQIGIALSRETDLPRLLETILVAAQEFLAADAGTLYQVNRANQTLEVAILRNNTLGWAMGGSSSLPVAFPAVPLYLEDGQPNHAMVAAYAVLNECTVNIADAYATQAFDFSGTRRFDAKNGYRSQSFLCVPLKNHRGEIIGLLQLINARNAQGQNQAFSATDLPFAEALASQAAIACTNRQLVLQLEQLFEAFVRLINIAIDDKSPYTGGHCARVPLLTMMLAEAVHASAQPGLADFKLSEDDRYEIKLASLLHDCGKITTPVHVVDKATKLHTLFDRIELVRTRMEILLRDVDLALARGQISAAAAHQEQQQLGQDLAFLERINLGGEFLPDADLENLQRIAQRRWSDKNGQSLPFLSQDEVSNLSVRRGTLTEDERNIINHHIVATIKMLEALPWPPHLARVPEYAGGHHERVDGQGYPKGLTREQMSIPARIMAIADVFEALTARDRPYKPAKKLSETMAIMDKMAATGHIDPDLYQVFVQQGVYRQYAALFLEADLLDV